MQAAQRKTEYRPMQSSSGKRIVKMDGNVAYIRNGERPSSGNAARGSHPVRVGSAKSTAARSKAATHPVRVGGAGSSRETFNGRNAKPIQKRVVHGSAKPKSSVIVNVNKTAVKNAKHANTGVVSTIFVIFIAFCALSLLISRYADISAIGTENSKLAGDINAIQVKIEELKVDMELQDNLENVRNTAQNVLGMTYPDQTQRVYLDMS